MKGYTCLFDDEDFELSEKCRIYITRNGKYNNIRVGRSLFSRIIMKVEDPNLQVDHINGNPLDNRKCNLRVVDKYYNSLNRALSPKNKVGYTGIFAKKNAHNSYIFYCNIYFKKVKYSNIFYDLKDAIIWRKMMENRYFGEFTRPNDKSIYDIIDDFYKLQISVN